MKIIVHTNDLNDLDLVAYAVRQLGAKEEAKSIVVSFGIDQRQYFRVTRNRSSFTVRRIR